MSGWKGKSKGTPLGYKFFIKIIRIFGLGFSYLFVRFVAFYYYLFAKPAKRALRDFYSKVPGIEKHRISKIIWKNFNYIGESIVDRMAFLSGKGDKITYTQEGEEYLKEYVDKGEALVLLSAHMGNWEIAGNLLKKLNAKVNVVMFDGESQKLKAMMQEELGSVLFEIIPIKNDQSHIYAIHAAVKNGEIICIHGDRFMEGAKTIETNFFNQTVELPFGPFQIASRLKAHHCFIFAVKNGKFNYHFTSTKPEICDSPEQVAEKYLRILEEKVKLNPEQWFNYFPYFKDDAG